MFYAFKRKAKKNELKHLQKTLGFEVTEKGVFIPSEYSGVVRLYTEDGLI